MGALAIAWRFATSKIGLPLVVAAALVVFYEGIPLGPLRSIPFIGRYLEVAFDGRVDRAWNEGRRDERVAWEEARRRQHAANERKRRADQAEIDDLTRKYLAEKEARAKALMVNSELDAALQASEAENNAEKDKNPACPPRPAISRGVSRALDKIGR